MACCSSGRYGRRTLLTTAIEITAARVETLPISHTGAVGAEGIAMTELLADRQVHPGPDRSVTPMQRSGPSASSDVPEPLFSSVVSTRTACAFWSHVTEATLFDGVDLDAEVGGRWGSAYGFQEAGGDTVKAIVRERYGPPEEVLELRDIDLPTIGDGEVLVRVSAASVNAGDAAIVRGSPYVIRPVYGVTRPRRRVIGQDLAGTVERVGAKVTRFSPGDEVFGAGFGSLAEYAAAPEKRLARKPDGLGFDTAAAVPIAGLTALQGLRDAARVEAGQRVLINGASGGVGTYAVQVAKALGAEVTAVCSTRNVDQARTIGADHVIDYTKEDFTAGAARYDVVFDNAASHPLATTLWVLADGGILIPNAGMLDRRWLANLPRMLGAATSTVFSRRRARLAAQAWRPDDLLTLGEWIEAGTVSPVIERTYPLSEAPDAVAYMGEGRARGKVVITV